MNRRPSLWILFAVTTGFGFIGAEAFEWYRNRHPVRFDAIRENDGIALENGRVELFYRNARYTRACPAQINRYLIRHETVDGHPSIHAYPLENTAGPLALVYPGDITLSLKVPADIPAGHYEYMSIRFDNCPLFPLFANIQPVISPRVPVEIVAPPVTPKQQPITVSPAPDPGTISPTPPELGARPN